MLSLDHRPGASRGFSLMEVLITVLLLAFGMLGLAGLEVRMTSSNAEAGQRAQAAALLSDMVERVRINANLGTGTIAAGYLTGATPAGTGDGNTVTDCTTVAIGVTRDMCEWSNALKGAAESSGTNKVGAMTGARGCISQIQAANATKNICTPGIYAVAVAWQGLTPTVAPPSSGLASCGTGLYGSGDTQRRVLSTQVVIALPSC
ncbi:MAG TPA: type IV pilus modification protein PilV [Nevskia sp.]|nr:type IV pilus modification protein PilV [Nevskia sp.]